MTQIAIYIRNKICGYWEKEKLSVYLGIIILIFVFLSKKVYNYNQEKQLSKGSLYTKVSVSTSYIRRSMLNIDYQYLYKSHTLYGTERVGRQDMVQGWFADRDDMQRVKKLELLVEFSSITPDYHRIRWDLVCELDKCFSDSTVNIWDSIPKGWVKGKY